MQEAKSILILKASKDICGDELGLLEYHCRLLNITVYNEEVKKSSEITDVVNRYSNDNTKFDFIYLCTHGDIYGFDLEFEEKTKVDWSRFSQLICETGILKDETILLLGCCKGGLFQVATDILAVCNKINFVCGVKWNVKAWDLTTGFLVFLHNLINKNAEPSYAAQKASLATDYTFSCYDRDEVEMMPQFENRQLRLYKELGWVDSNGNWIESDPQIKENTGH